MSFWKSLFGGGQTGGAASTDPATAKSVRQLEHNGYLIEARPYSAEGQFQVAGTISKVVDGERKEHRFIRADRYATIDDAAEIAIRKGCQIADQQGDKIFADGPGAARS